MKKHGSNKKYLTKDKIRKLIGQNVRNKLSKKNTVRLQRMKNTQSEIKLIKTGKEIGTTYCLGCKDYTHNFKTQ